MVRVTYNTVYLAFYFEHLQKITNNEFGSVSLCLFVCVCVCTRNISKFLSYKFVWGEGIDRRVVMSQIVCIKNRA